MAEIRAFLTAQYPLLLIAVAALTLLIWYIVFFRAVAPRKGTLEWIAFTDLPRMTLPAVQYLSGKAWISLLLAAVCGAANCLLRMDAVYPASLIYAALPAVSALVFCMLLLQLFGSPVSAACGAVLLAACELAMPATTTALLCALWLLMLALMRERTVVRVLCLVLSIAAAIGALYLRGCIAADGASLIVTLPMPALPLLQEFTLPALLPITAIVIALIGALRLHRGDLLFGALFGLLCLPAALFSMPYLVCAGGIAALAGTFAAAEARGKTPIPAALILLVCTILYSL